VEVGPRNAYNLSSVEALLSGKQCARKRASICLGRGGEKRTERNLARRLLYFFSTLKGECVDRQDFQTRQEARLVIFEYIECFYVRSVQPKLALTSEGMAGKEMNLDNS
jgi:hypothetical protein